MSLSKSSSKRQTVVAVFPESKEGLLALEALKMGAAELKHTTVERLPFDRLDFGETAILDKFYSANMVVADVTEKSYQATVFYQLGLRESFDMRHNIVTCVDQQSSYQAGRRGANPAGQTTLPTAGVSPAGRK